ncbi:MAG: HsdM family class I SAM-dependent methyltransferase [Gaiellaceae bacterium]
MTGRVIEDDVQTLVERVRASATAQDAEGLRRAYEQVLARLEVTPDRLEAWRDGKDIVGSAYEQLLSPQQRRSTGQFFTPFWAGELMAGWLYSESAKLLLDAGCGSGGLVIPAARHPDRGHSRLLGIDADPIAIAMAKANKRLREIERCELRVANFLTDGLDEQPDRVVSNPPYSRHNAIPRDQRLTIHSELERVFGLRFSRRTSLQALFFLRALELSSDDAWLAFITPSDWLDVNYGLEVKRCLLERAHVEALILLDAEHLFFDGARTTAVITLVRKGIGGRTTRVIRLGKELPKPGVVLDAVGGGRVNPVLTMEEVSLSAEFKWARTAPKRRRGSPLNEVARVHRGIATGANQYFCLTEDERARRGIPRADLRSCLTSPKHFDQVDLTQDVLDRLPGSTRRWLVDCDDFGVESAKTPLGTYLRRGRRLKVHTGYLVSNRRPWYSQEQRVNAPIVFTYLNKHRPRFLRNHAGAVPLNNWLVIAPRDGVNVDALFAALSAPTVSKQLREQARFYGGGMWKLEPSELERIILPVSFTRNA